MSAERDVAILGVGMHPWGKWGHDFTEYGMVAARAALDDAGLAWHDIQYVAGADTIRNGYPGLHRRRDLRAEARLDRACACRRATRRARRARRRSTSARAQILAGFCDVALVIGADTTPKGFFAPVGGERKTDPDWLRFHLLGATNPVYFALYARRRMDVYGATTDDFARVKVKNSRHGLENPNARFRKENSVEDVVNSPVVADPLRLLDICATSDGAAAMIVSSMDFARSTLGIDRRHPARQGRVDGHAALPADGARAPRLRHRLHARSSPPPDRGFKDSIAGAAYEEAGIGPDDLSLAEVYDLSTALELDWYENIGLCGEGEAEALLRSGATELGGRIPVNPSGGLACFGEAIPAQAIAQVCEVTWQLRGQAGGRQVEGATRRHHRQPGICSVTGRP